MDSRLRGNDKRENKRNIDSFCGLIGLQSDGNGSLKNTLEDENLGEAPEARMPLRDDRGE